MGKKEEKGSSPKIENRCPACGRFASKRVIDAHKDLMSEVERTQRTEIARLKNEYASLQRVCESLRKELSRYESMNLWDRLFNW